MLPCTLPSPGVGPPFSDSSYSRGGKSTGKHRQGSSPLHPPCTISLFFLWQQKLHIHREKLVLMVERGGPSPPAPYRGCSCTTTALLSTTPHYIYAMVALDIFHCLHLMVFPLFVTAPTQQS